MQLAPPRRTLQHRSTKLVARSAFDSGYADALCVRLGFTLPYKIKVRHVRNDERVLAGEEVGCFGYAGGSNGTLAGFIVRFGFE